MFLDFYGLREQPFGVSPDPAYLYFSRTHREALDSLLYGLKADRGFVSLISGPGMGKTTLLYRLMDELRDFARTVFLFQTQCDSREFFSYLLVEFGIDPTGMGLASMHKKLNDILFNEMLAGKRVVVIVDEAQNLEAPVLETVRLLSDFETAHAKLLEIVLAGQPQLADTLAQPNLSQLRQRIAMFTGLEPLSAGETACYILHRLKIAGHSGGALFAPDASALIAEQSRGIPRAINNICFSALSLGAARRQPTISSEIVRLAGQFPTIGREVAQELFANVSVESDKPPSHPDESLGADAATQISSLKLFPGEPVAELPLDFQQLISTRAYQLFESRGCVHGHDREDWLCAESEILLNVPVEIKETETEVTIRAEVLGFGEDDLELRAAPGSISIIGERQGALERKEGEVVDSRHGADRIYRVFDLPSQVDVDTLEATVGNGGLEIRVSKIGTAKKIAAAAKAAAASRR